MSEFNFAGQEPFPGFSPGDQDFLRGVDQMMHAQTTWLTPGVQDRILENVERHFDLLDDVIGELLSDAESDVPLTPEQLLAAENTTNALAHFFDQTNDIVTEPMPDINVTQEDRAELTKIFEAFQDLHERDAGSVDREE